MKLQGHCGRNIGGFGYLGMPTVLIGLYLAILLYNTWPVNNLSISNAGILGDSFGVLTSWFSGMAFCAAVYLLKVQQAEFDNIRAHAEKMSKIERASFQPILEPKSCIFTKHEFGGAEIIIEHRSDKVIFPEKIIIKGFGSRLGHVV